MTARDPVPDPQTLRALAHPLRLDLLELLAAIGPATAAQCGRRLGVPQANCSFHLRQLAKYGLVEQAEGGEDRRERRWRTAGRRQTLRVGPGADADARLQLEQVVVQREMNAILEHAERRRAAAVATGTTGTTGTDEADPWQDAAGIFSQVLLLSAAEAAALKEQWRALLAPYSGRTAQAPDGHDGERLVRLFMATTPMDAHHPGGEQA